MTNIRERQQQFNALRPKMKLNNSAFLNSFENEREAAKTPQAKQSLRNKLFAHTKTLVDGGTADGLEVADGWFAMLDIIDAEISAVTAGNRAAGVVATNHGWINAETGNPVVMLAPGEAMADHITNPVRGDGESAGATVGGIVQALLTGRKSQSVQAALSEGDNSAGGYMIPLSVMPGFIDRLRSSATFVQAGARTLLLEGAKTRIVKIENDPSASWRAENAAVVEGQPTFGALDFVPKSLAVLVRASIELLQDSANAQDALEHTIVNAIALELDRAAYFGTGNDNQPRGLFNTDGVNVVSLGANGGAITNYDPFIDAMYETELRNSRENTAAVMHPRTMRTLRKLKDGQSQPLRMPTDVEALPKLTTTSFPIDQAQGTGTNLSSIVQGDFAHAILGIRQQLVIKLLDQPFADHLQVGFLAYMRADVQFSRPAAFTKVTGIAA